MKEIFDEGVVKREEMFITSKCWNTHHRRAKVSECCKTSLSNLQLDYLDLYLIHWPVAFTESDELFPRNEQGEIIVDNSIDYIETWQGMEDCYNQGLAKSIGVSNFTIGQIERVLSICKVKPVMNQVECHPYLNQEEMRKFCSSKDIRMTAYSPLGSPANQFTKGNPMIIEDPKIKVIADKYKKSVGQLLIKFNIQRGICCIPKSVKNERLVENSKVFDFEISEEDMTSLLNIGTNCRFQMAEW